MDEFGSPLSGGINAVRRNISSSFFSGAQQQKPDPVTTDLLQQQSLQLTSVSQNLESISRQVSTLDRNLLGVKENLALTEQLERQREGARQNRERILAEQGLREGKESALEAKIQSSLTQPLQRIGIKTQSTLGSLTQFLLTLAGGWLTITGIDLLQALSEGNVDKINALKVRFLGGLTIIAGSLTAISIGIKSSLAILGRFAGAVGRAAFGGLLRAGLKGVQVLLAGLVRKSRGIGKGIFGGGIGGTIGGIVEILVGNFLFNKAGKIFKLFRNPVKTTKLATETLKKVANPNNITNAIKNIRKVKIPGANRIKDAILGKETFQRVPTKLNTSRFFSGADPTMAGNPLGAPVSMGRKGGLVGFGKNLFKRGKTLVDDGAKAIAKTGIGGKLTGLVKGLPKMGVGKLLGRVFGPLITFFAEITSAEGGLVSALSAVAGYLAGAKVGAIIGAALGTIVPGLGNAVGGVIGAIVGGFLGEELMKGLSKKIMAAFGFKDIKVFGNKDKNDKSETELKNLEKTVDEDGDLVSTMNFSDDEIKILNEGGKVIDGKVVPVKSNSGNAANQINSFEEKPEVISVDMGAATNGQNNGGVSGGNSKDQQSLPTINFDQNNTHALYATSTTGAG